MKMTSMAFLVVAFINVVFTVNAKILVSKYNSNCFQTSQVKGRMDNTAFYASDSKKLSDEYAHGMHVNKLRLCGSDTDFFGI